MNSLLAARRIEPSHLAWIEGAPVWQEVGTLPGVRIAPRAVRRPVVPPANESDRLVLPAFLLAFFLGVFGAHRFYCGRNGSAVVMLVLTLTGIGAIVTGIWHVIDWIVIVCCAFRDGEGRLLRRWT
ncbi:MAG: TM2 domain-containing protein [Planctomycetes bacterium]|nr:TM2 domain-containing protein [Planctomycetota bacterium]